MPITKIKVPTIDIPNEFNNTVGRGSCLIKNQIQELSNIIKNEYRMKNKSLFSIKTTLSLLYFKTNIN